MALHTDLFRFFQSWKEMYEWIKVNSLVSFATNMQS